ncbi:MAG: hypothetical protein DSM107014_16315 [Gomphosphaeria aponina SAG 52.96 = DSM 107014]|uniref:Uncharacterized protein n=1 Tax=Gomphosphaeria aponina SAG 52.96 = DSM 107014 TaxID=1521640 RepID=A0A941GS92_9CHRO|nr:hypothetical protein [Gomphosphaeria aponina SAG 52.96 = DSM 107014]
MNKTLPLANLKTLTLSLGTVLTILASLGQFTLAQSVNQQDNYQSNEVDSFSGSSLGNGSLNPLDLIHRANLSNGRSVDEFTQDSSANINDAATEFKRKQQEQLQNQQQQPASLSTPEN